MTTTISKREQYEVQKKSIITSPEFMGLMHVIIDSSLRLTDAKYIIKIKYPELLPFATDDVLERQARLYDLIKKLIHTKLGQNLAARMQERRQEDEDAKQLEKWREALRWGELPDDMCDYLDENLPGWRADARELAQTNALIQTNGLHQCHCCSQMNSIKI